MAINEEVDRLFSYLASLSYCVSRGWLTGCVEYFREENPQYSVKDLQEFVRKQWELSDLRDSSDGCLPHNLQTQVKITLRGMYAVQIEYVINISEPAYSQLQKTRKVDVTNVDATEKKPEAWEPRPRRMLKLILCDGPQQVQAIEYKPLHMLHEHILPGTKILIIGPVDCRRGVFFLKAENIKVIGGEVDTLLTANHFENVLARALGLPENPDPFSNDSASTAAVPPTDTQRSTYTPSVTPVPVQANQTSNMRQMATSVATGTTQPRHMQDTFGSRSQLQTVSGVDDLEGTGWTVDDLQAEGDEDFLEIPEQTSLAEDSPQSSSAIASSANAAQFSHSVIGKQHNISSAVLGNDVSKMSSVSAYKSATSMQKTSTKNSNPFLASDEYLASVDMDMWEDEDLNENFSILPEPKDTVFESNNKEVPVGSLKNVPLQTNVNNNPCGPQNSNYSNTSSNSRSVQSNVKFKEFASTARPSQIQQPPFTFNSNTSLRKEQCNLNKEILKDLRIKPTNLFTSNITPQKSDVRSGEDRRISFKQYFNSNLQNSENQCNFKTNRRVSTEQISNEEQAPKSNQQLHSRSPPSLDVFENEEDWGDAYLSSQSANCMQNYKDCDVSQSPTNPLKFPLSPVPNATEVSSTSLKSPSSVLGARKLSSTYMKPSSALGISKLSPTAMNVISNNKLACSSSPSTSTQTKGLQVFRQGGTSADRNSSFESRSHLLPAISSPSDMNDEPNHIKKLSEMKTSSTSYDDHVSTTRNASNVLSLGCKTVALSHKPSSTNSMCNFKSPVPFVYLWHILQSGTDKFTGTHRIKATIMSLLCQLTADPSEGWRLSAKICDGTTTLDVQFSSKVLDEIIGLSAYEFKKMKKEFPKNPLLKDQLIKLLQRSRQKLINLNCLFDIKFETDKMAKVVNLNEISQQDIDELSLRLKDI